MKRKAQSIKAGQENVATVSPGLFACKQISFKSHFSGAQQVNVLASIGHREKSSLPRNSAALWVESITKGGFKVCVLEYGKGSNKTAKVNWISFQTAPVGSQIGSIWFNSLTSGTECKTISFKQPFATAPAMYVTASHQVSKEAYEAIAVWVEDFPKDSYKICIREAKMFTGPHKKIKIDWMAFTDLRVENFTMTDSLLFQNTNSPSHQNNYAFCQIITFPEQFYTPPVVLVSPKHSLNNNYSHLSGAQCNAVTAWVEHTSTAEAKVCVRNYNSNADSKESINVDYLIIGDLHPCLNMTCQYHGLCKAFGPRDARCVCVDSCPSYQEPVCSSNGTTYDNECLYKQEMCVLQMNFSIHHPGSCEDKNKN